MKLTPLQKKSIKILGKKKDSEIRKELINKYPFADGYELGKRYENKLKDYGII